jgi:hypothetical protein
VDVGSIQAGVELFDIFEFRVPVQVSILSERRMFHAYGLEGGEVSVDELAFTALVKPKMSKGQL